MEIPIPKTPYILDNDQDRRIYDKLDQLRKRELTNEQEELVRFLYTQLETNWRTPLEEEIDNLLLKIKALPGWRNRYTRNT